MSKPRPSARRHAPDAGTGRIRLFRNFYTRNGSRHYVRGWRIKIQIAGSRTTHALRAGDRVEAAAEAARLVQSLRAPAAVNDPGPEASRVRLVHRPHLPPAAEPGQWSTCLPLDGHPVYFPLGTCNARDAARRARRLHRDLRRHGLPGLHARHPREVTLALHWSTHPVLWTYTTLHTRPDATPAAGNCPSPGGWRIGVVEPEAALASAIAESLVHSGQAVQVTLWRQPMDAAAALHRDAADLVLLHQPRDTPSGAELIASLRLRRPHSLFVEYSVHADSEELFRSTPGGAPLYVLRRTPWDRMLEALDGLPRPGTGGSVRWMRHVQEYFQKQVGARAAAPHQPPLPSLTPREAEILGWMARGFLDKEIARELRISVWTVHGHAKRIYEKLGVHSRTEAVVRYLQK